MATIESYLYSAGSTATNLTSLNSITVDEGGGSSGTFRLDESKLMSAALIYWADTASAALAAGVYSFSHDSDTNRVTLRTTNSTNFTVTFIGHVGKVLGFANASYSGDDTYTGESEPLALFTPAGVDCEVPEPKVRTDLVEYRHGRMTSTSFSNHLFADLTLWFTRTNADLFLTSCCTSGKVRVKFDSSTAFSTEAPDGYIDGFVYRTPSITTIGEDENFVGVEMSVAMGVS